MMATNTPKTMSSRLATMKFMQRSASKSAASTSNGPPAKKVRLSTDASTPSIAATPSDHGTPPSVSADDQRREDALARAAEKAGETRWVLSLQDPQLGFRPSVMPVRQAGFGVIDAEDSSDEEGEDIQPLRMQFGGGIKKKKKVTPTDAQNEGDVSESGSSDPEEYDPTDALIRETEREIKAKARNARNKRQQEQSTPVRSSMVVNEDMDLANLTSLSGGGSAGRANIVCHKCFNKGHVMANCPKLAQRGPAGRGVGRVRF